MFKISFLKNKINKKNYTNDNNNFVKSNYVFYKKKLNLYKNLENYKNYLNQLNFDNNNIF